MSCRGCLPLGSRLMSPELGAWLRQQREDRGWTRSELARQLIKVARTKGDMSVPSADNISHNIYRWERGAVTPAERYQLYYCGAFGIPFSQFGAPASPGTPPGALVPPGMVDHGPGASAATAYRGLPSADPAAPDRGAPAIRREVLMAAHEGSEHAERAEQRGIGEATLEQFRADTASLSVQYLTGEPFPLFAEMRRGREPGAAGAPRPAGAPGGARGGRSRPRATPGTATTTTSCSRSAASSASPRPRRPTTPGSSWPRRARPRRPPSWRPPPACTRPGRDLASSTAGGA